MTFRDFQWKAYETAIYPREHCVIYPALGLASEAGEVCGKVKKLIRDNAGSDWKNQRAALSAELGDVLWYLATLAGDLGLDLNEVAEENLAKLAARKERGTLSGSGDDR